jgi:hypothetical protein
MKIGFQQTERYTYNMKLTISVKKWKLPTINPKFSSAAAGNGYINMKSGPRPNGNMKLASRPNGNMKVGFKLRPNGNM